MNKKDIKLFTKKNTLLVIGLIVIYIMTNLYDSTVAFKFELLDIVRGLDLDLERVIFKYYVMLLNAAFLISGVSVKSKSKVLMLFIICIILLCVAKVNTRFIAFEDYAGVFTITLLMVQFIRYLILDKKQDTC
ncbi:hypothetical protein EZV73_00070 [Acidaminobacter sp. JC074]|uniref:hypothetical protein n=1 Tax=Acidaminobacter sp. JC074 TaxID=2530199 RepID=UPI001F102952|nr:hypothetical protein [Acidaminobacter sp. JC074]MCH4885933.1 hypothetical protein [Acidaminobacter sp. JC074]